MDNAEFNQIAVQLYEAWEQKKELYHKIDVLQNDQSKAVTRDEKLEKDLKTSVDPTRPKKMFHIKENDVIMVGWVSKDKVDVFIAQLI